MSGDVTPVCLPADDAVELGELLACLVQWIDRHPDRAGRALVPVVSAGYRVNELRADLARFAFLLGQTHPGLVFGPHEEQPR